MTMSMYPPPQMAVMETLVPPGTIVPTVKAEADAGYLLCDGASYAKADYPALFAALGGELSVWGGVTSTHFAVPDLRGRVPVGANGDNQADKAFAILGSVVGAKEHTLTVAEMPSHSHNRVESTPAGATVAGRINTANTQGTTTSRASSSEGGGGAHNNVQPSVGVTYQIKA